MLPEWVVATGRSGEVWQFESYTARPTGDRCGDCFPVTVDGMDKLASEYALMTTGLSCTVHSPTFAALIQIMEGVLAEGIWEGEFVCLWGLCPAIHNSAV